MKKGLVRGMSATIALMMSIGLLLAGDSVHAENDVSTEADSSDGHTSQSTAEGDVSASDVSVSVNTLGATLTVVYLNGNFGRDSNDGLTADTAVNSFPRAIEIAAELDA